jgi:radical SAM-linked protein
MSGNCFEVNAVIMQRIRVYYAKTDDLRFTSNLDIQKIWERTLRRGHISVMYSQGFHPQPKIQLACPLPLGMTSTAEIMDFWMEAEVSPIEINSRLEKVIPPGIQLQRCELIDLSEPSLQTQVLSTIYRVSSMDGNFEPSISQKTQALLEQPSLERTRRKKTYDLRPMIESLRLVDQNEGSNFIEMRLSARPGATGRPEEVLDCLGLDITEVKIERTSIVTILSA